MGQVISYTIDQPVVSFCSIIGIWFVWELWNHRRQSTVAEQIPYEYYQKPETTLKLALVYVTRSGQRIRHFYVDKNDECNYDIERISQWDNRSQVVAISRDA